MSLPAPLTRVCALSVVLLLAACQKAQSPPATAVPAAWPASLHVFGDGFPNAGDPCRRVGESAATADFLDHTAALVGCHSTTDAGKLGGRIVATVDGITLVSVPQ